MDRAAWIKTICTVLGLALLAGCAATTPSPSAGIEAGRIEPFPSPSPANTGASAGKGKLQQNQEALRAALTESIPPDMTIWFPDGQPEIAPQPGQRLQELADRLKQDKQLDAQLTSKSNTNGSHSLCLAQAAAKLNAVTNRLLQLGVQPYQIRQRNMGCEAPLLAQPPCSNNDCLLAKERVEIRLLK